MGYDLRLNNQIKLGVNQKQNQLLMMLPKMQQAIAFLQAPVQELSTLIQVEMEQNPLIEQDEEPDDEDVAKLQKEEDEESESSDASESQEVAFDDHDFEVMKQLNEEYQDHFAQSGSGSQRTKEDDEYHSFLESSICEEVTLSSFLSGQVKENIEDQEDRKLAEIIIGSLDDRGFLATPLEELAALLHVPLENFEKVLTAIQGFEPSGVGAHDLRESFLIQLRLKKRQDTVAYKILSDHYEDFISNRLPQIQKALQCSIEEIQEAIENDIVKLDLRPGAWFVNSQAAYIVPDAILHEEDGKITIELHRDSQPGLRVSPRYFRMMEDPEASDETKDYVRQHLNSAKWLLRNIYQRNDTLMRVIESITEHQKEFLTISGGHIKPLIMKEIAEELKLHESTIARAVANKYVATSKGVLPLRHFFSNSYTTDQGDELSSDTVRQAIKKIIAEEDKTQPLSDEKISNELNRQGIPCARRTVAKYRQLLKIGNTHQRKKFV